MAASRHQCRTRDGRCRRGFIHTSSRPRAGTHTARSLNRCTIAETFRKISPWGYGSRREAGTTRRVLRFNDAEHDFAFSRRDAPEVMLKSFALQKRGRREDRVRAAPAVPRASCRKQNAHEHTGSAETLRPSPRNGFTAYNALSPVSRALLPPLLRQNESTQRDASLRASGPRDFAVRCRHVRLRDVSVHRIPPRVRDDRDPPLLSGETG